MSKEKIFLEIINTPTEPQEFQRTRPDPPFELSYKEAIVVKLVIKGLMNKNIADKLNISPNTVKAHLSNVFKKRNIHCRSELAYEFLKRMIFLMNYNLHIETKGEKITHNIKSLF